MGFIYKVTNIINQKVYIGKTEESVEKRWKEHVLDSRKDCLLNRPFYNAIRKYGIDNFIVETIEEVNDNLLEEREIYWIDYYQSYVHFPNSKGYNMTLGGDGTRKYNYKEIVEDYLITKSKKQTAKNFNCDISTVRNAINNANISTLNNSAGRNIQQIDPKTTEIIQEFSSIRQAALYIAKNNNINFDTVRKRLNYLIIHHPEQKGYGYYWKLLSS